MFIIQMTANNNYDVLVLSGNSTNGIGTLGALQRLYDNGVLKDIKHYVGTSSGGIISMLLGIGYTPLDILCHIGSKKLFDTMTLNPLGCISAGGIMSFEPIEYALRDMIVTKLGVIPTMEELLTRFHVSITVVTYNMTKGEKEYVNALTHPTVCVLKALRMTSNFPFVFGHYAINDCYYTDGGIVDNLAVEYAETLGRHCLGVYTEGLTEGFDPTKTPFEYIHYLMCVRLEFYYKDKINKLHHTDVITVQFKHQFFDFFNTCLLNMIALFDDGYDECTLPHESGNERCSSTQVH